jgi:hypothetical protein
MNKTANQERLARRQTTAATTLELFAQGTPRYTLTELLSFCFYFGGLRLIFKVSRPPVFVNAPRAPQSKITFTQNFRCCAGRKLATAPEI